MPGHSRHSDSWWLLYDKPQGTAIYVVTKARGRVYTWFDLYVVHDRELYKLALKPGETVRARRTGAKSGFMANRYSTTFGVVAELGLLIHRNPAWFIARPL